MRFELVNFNLDVKNPNVVELADLSPVELLTAYREKQACVAAAIREIRSVLERALAHHES